MAVDKRALTLFILPLILPACTSPEPTGRLAFSSDRDGNAEIYLINADGLLLRSLTDHPATDFGASWAR